MLSAVDSVLEFSLIFFLILFLNTDKALIKNNANVAAQVAAQLYSGGDSKDTNSESVAPGSSGIPVSKPLP